MNYLCVPLCGKRGGITRITESAWRLADGIRWYKSANGYAISPRAGLMHRRLIAAESGEHVDHKNFDRLDNRDQNIRTCTQQANNSRTQKRNTPWPYKGVRFMGTKWQARLAGKYLGSFVTAIEAAKAYDSAALAIYGPMAALNLGGNQ